MASRVKAIIVDELGVEEPEVTNGVSFTNDLGADSLDTVELIMESEKEFGISIPDDRVEKIGIAGDAVSYIEEHAKQLLDFISMELKRAAVTGLGVITPADNDIPEFWENLVNGVSGAGPITHFDASQSKTRSACEVKNFDVTKYIDRKEARKMDLHTQCVVAVVKEAVSDPGLDVGKEDLSRIGVIFGVGIGGIHIFEEEVGNYYTHQKIGPKFNPFFIPRMISDIVAGQISITYGFYGSNYATCSAYATSTNAIADAFNPIRLGKANIIVFGGSEVATFPAGVGGFNAMHALSTHNDKPSKTSRPFSASRDGFIMGESGGCLISEELEHAKARGAKIYAEVAGVGMSADARYLAASHPEGLGAKLVMLNALEDAKMDPKEVGYINVHGASTSVGDISEARAIREVFGDHTYEPSISPTRSMTGHLLGAAGAVEPITSIFAIKNDIVPPTINHEEGDNDKNIDYDLSFTFNKTQKREVNVAPSNTSGFGGHNACIISKKYVE